MSSYRRLSDAQKELFYECAKHYNPYIIEDRPSRLNDREGVKDTCVIWVYAHYVLDVCSQWDSVFIAEYKPMANLARWADAPAEVKEPVARAVEDLEREHRSINECNRSWARGILDSLSIVLGDTIRQHDYLAVRCASVLEHEYDLKLSARECVSVLLGGSSKKPEVKEDFDYFVSEVTRRGAYA